MNIGIIGTGNVGSSLGKRWTDAGHTVMFGSRDTEKAQELAGEVGGRSMGGTYQEAVDFGAVVVLAVVWDAVKDTLAGLTGLDGKVLIETTNNFGVPLQGSTTENIARWAKGAKVVKTFNTIFAEIINMSPDERAYRATAFMAGDDAGAKAITAQLISDAGFEPFDVGGAAAAHHLDKLASFIVEMGYGKGMGRYINYQVGKVSK